jgi:hypothetical protein
MIFKKKWARYVIHAIACVQIVGVLMYPGLYSYSSLNLRHSMIVQRDHHLTFREFFDESLFGRIKEDLQYSGEGVAALGFHPNVLMFNGFSSVDGYNNNYPLAYMQAFREVIAPQLERNPDHQQYFDYWGGRMYLFNDDIGFAPTRTRHETPVELHINTDAFRRLGGVYILSRAEISNAADLRLSFVNHYNCESSIYEIFVYRID